MSEPLRVAMVMPPTIIGDPKAVVASWTTLTRTIAEVHAVADVAFHVIGRHDSGPYQWADGTDVYSFVASDRQLGTAVALARPDVVHVHGLTHVRQRWAMHYGMVAAAGRWARPPAPVVLQHHGEPVPRVRTRFAHGLAPRPAGYLFTGADHGQAQPFIDSGMLSRSDRLFEVLEAGSLLPAAVATDPVVLPGSPSILWVGRLIESKRPLLAIEAFRQFAARRPDAHLHLLATDRSLELAVRAAIVELGPLGEQVHLHDPVPHERMVGWYSAVDVYLSTSVREGSNYSLIEALTLGCAPAVSNIPSHRAIVGDLAEPFAIDDPGAAARAIEHAATLSRADVAAFAHDRLSWRSVAVRLVEIWQFLRTQART